MNRTPCREGESLVGQIGRSDRGRVGRLREILDTSGHGDPARRSARPRQGKVAGAHERFGLQRGPADGAGDGRQSGAHSVNEWMAAALLGLQDWRSQTQFVHLSGTRDEVALRAAYERNGFEAIVMSFCKQMELPYSAADLVIARAGAASLTELAAFGLPAILIPYAQAAEIISGTTPGCLNESARADRHGVAPIGARH